ncbi:hypothetical protein PCASD_23369 [Puccinia coronata f. sp. avenae]|uniref:Uncharacterized protein n=1 Tax=Puccinia coronata f. sp. avenae TaxID=200324 RepID=A0A2N5SGU9_9BASI|nr:hypothetical protein PCASD_23369 [Puccinia coronata f. sp. avenae]
MARLVDLPEDVVSLVFQYLVRIDDALLEGLSTRSHAEGRTAAALRLVCRKWADWLFVHHLYRTLTFTDGSRLREFLRRLTPPHDHPAPGKPHCQHLMVYDIWAPDELPVQHPPPDPSIYHHHHQPEISTHGIMMNTFQSLDILVSFFQDTIVELDLEFIGTFWLPRRSLELIGGIENLSVLRLSLKSECISSRMTLESSSRGEQEEASGGGLQALIRAAPRLEGLDISELPLNCLPRSFPVPPQSTAATITQLDIRLTDQEQPMERLVALAGALKPALKVLSIQSFRDDGRRLVPLLETLWDTLEGLFISHESALTHVLHLQFPQLVVFRVNYWDGCLSHLLSQDLFANAPIQVLALYSHTLYRRRNSFLQDPFHRLKHLNKLVFLHARLHDLPPPCYLHACAAHRLQPVFLNHGHIPDIMRLARR